MQYAMDIPPALRANIDYVFCLRENIQANREKLYKVRRARPGRSTKS